MRNRFYPTSGSTEPSMRQELINTLDGTFPEVAKKHPVLLRKMRRENGLKIACPCTDILTKEPDRDHFCPICIGEGFLWDESSIDAYSVILRSDVGNAQNDVLFKPGVIKTTVSVFYVKYDVDITEDDKIVEVRLTTDGEIYVPYQRVGVFKIATSIDLRLDNGRLEYHKVLCFLEKRKYLNNRDG